MPLSAKVTTDHETIRRWVQDRGGHPAVVKGRPDNDAALLHIDFPGHPQNGAIARATWEDFFERFERHQLAFLYQERTSTGGTSRLFRIVTRS
jgi:hypothetical protein